MQQLKANTMNKIYLVQVIERATAKVVKEIACETINRAVKVADGIEINLNQDDYRTYIREL